MASTSYTPAITTSNLLKSTAAFMTHLDLVPPLQSRPCLINIQIQPTCSPLKLISHHVNHGRCVCFSRITITQNSQFRSTAPFLSLVLLVAPAELQQSRVAKR